MGSIGGAVYRGAVPIQSIISHGNQPTVLARSKSPRL